MVLNLTSEREVRPNTFVEWLREMELDTKRAAILLGRSVRSIEYFVGGRRLPLTLMYLMEAVSEGFVARHARRKLAETKKARRRGQKHPAIEPS
jgi:hypothetical protein